MARFFINNIFWVVQNAAGYHPESMQPSRTDGGLFVVLSSDNFFNSITDKVRELSSNSAKKL